MTLDKRVASEKLRTCLEKRLAAFFSCDVGSLPRLRLGEIVHLMFLLWGSEETLGGFHGSINAVLQLIGREILWEAVEPKAEETEPKVVIN